jgi:hypothetical protein
MTGKKPPTPRTSVYCSSGPLCFLQNYKYTSPGIIPGKHSTPDDAARCEAKANAPRAPR